MIAEERRRPAIFDYQNHTFGPSCHDFPGCTCGTMPKYSIKGFGRENARVMLVGIAPGRQEEIWKAPLVGPSGTRNDLCLRAVKYPREKVYATNLICWKNDAPSPEEIAACWPRLRAEIETVRPRLILALGALACDWLTGYSIGRIRGNLIRPEYNRSEHFAELFTRGDARDPLFGEDGDEGPGPLPTILPTWHPAATLRITSLATDVIRDYAKIRPFLRGRYEPLQWDWRLVTRRKEAQEVLDSLTGCTVAIDVETEKDVNDAFGKVVCVAMAVEDPRGIRAPNGDPAYFAYVFPVEVLKGLKWPKKVKWIEHNMGYDNPIIAREFEIWLTGVHDTFIDSLSRDERPGRDEEGSGDRQRSGEDKKPKGPGYHGLKQLSAEYCLDPGARVLKADLQWSCIGDVEVGDELIGFDEFPPKSSPSSKERRKLRPSVVLEKRLLTLPRFFIQTDKGSVICSTDHSWLGAYPKKVGGPKGKNNPQGGRTQKSTWLRSSELRLGDRISWYCAPWEQDTSLEGQYLRGFFDGEGSARWSKGRSDVSFGQLEGPVLDYVCSLLKEKGYDFGKYPVDQPNGKRCWTISLKGENSLMRFLGQIRPIRLLRNTDGAWSGRSIYGPYTTPATVTRIQALEPGQVVAIRTSTGTFIAEGMLSHNCGAPPGYGDEMKKSFGKTLEEIAAPQPILLTPEEIECETASTMAVDLLAGDRREPVGGSSDRSAADGSDAGSAPEATGKPTAKRKASAKRKAALPMRMETPEEAQDRFERFLQALYKYNAFDAVNTVALPSRLPGKPCPARDTILMPAARAYARIHLQGVPVDLERAQQLHEEWTPWIEELEAELQQEAHAFGFRNQPTTKRDTAAKEAYEDEYGRGTWPLGRSAEEKKRLRKEGTFEAARIAWLEEYGPNSWPGYEPINLGSSLQLGKLLYGKLRLPIKVRSKKTGKPSVGKEAIADIEHPFVARMEEVRTAQHVKTSHLDPIPELVKGDGRIHATIWTVGATNYRRAITGPPLQQYPQEHPKPFWKKLAEVRSVLRPDPGFCFIEADYRQIELHGAARLSGDQVFLEDLKTGDYHTRIVREVFHCDDPEDSVVFHHTRRIGKVFNFAVLYRVEENTLSKAMNEGIAFGTNSKPVTPREAGRLIRQWYTRNRTYWLWQEELLKEVKRKGRLVNPFGEVRRFPLYDPLLDKQIVNFPVSSTCGAHSEISLIELEPIIRRNFGGSILFDTHDSLLFHVPTKKRRSAARIIREIMEEPKIPGWDPLEIEFKMSEVNWRQMKVWDERA